MGFGQVQRCLAEHRSHADACLCARPGNGITFKTTLKGMSKLNNAALGDLWIPVASLAALGAALGIGCRDLVRFC